MPFTPPSWVPGLPFDPPDSITVGQFMQDETYGRLPLKDSKDPFVCGITGRTYSALKMKERTESLARGLAKDLHWHPNEGSEWEKVVATFSHNTVDTIATGYAVHRLSGIVTPASAAYTASELIFQLKSSGAKALVTCIPLLKLALMAAKSAGIPEKHVYILEMPEELTGGGDVPFKSVNQLIEEGDNLPEIEPLRWEKGQGARQTAYLCYSSGTSGYPKGVMISHRNVIANTLQITAFESHGRKLKGKGTESVETALGILPQSHIYGLVVISHASTYRGDCVIILPKFELNLFLSSIQKFKITELYLVPPIIINMINNRTTCSKYDLGSVRSIITGAAPLGVETAEALHKIYPTWAIRQCYGLTETSTAVCMSSSHDICLGTSGSLIPGVTVKLVRPDGVEITSHHEPGELFVQSPAVVLGYLKNCEADRETFLADTDGKGKWMRTGDEAIITESIAGNEHITITDRIKELIKVKGQQVAPAELEAHILSHPFVADVAVIPVPDDAAGEVPKAFVVKSSTTEDDDIVAQEIRKHVEDHKSKYKWLKGGVEFISLIPKSPSGKILRRLLRDKEKAARQKTGPSL